MFCVKQIENLKTLKYHTFMIKHFFFLVLLISVVISTQKVFEAEDSIEILKFLDLANNM